MVNDYSITPHSIAPYLVTLKPLACIILFGFLLFGSLLLGFLLRFIRRGPTLRSFTLAKGSVMDDAPNSEHFALRPIGHVMSDYPDKFGIPRQPGLAPAASARLVLAPPYNDPLAVRGLEDFSHLWLSFIFHQSPDRWSPLVRPPRLGGNKKVGVFASRSTHRPNRLGLSLVRLVGINTQQGVVLTLQGCDLVSGTPVVDIKPYLPWAESQPNAQAGFAPQTPSLMPVSFHPAALDSLAQRSDSATLHALIEQVLSQDPRPAYQQKDSASGRLYGVRLRDVDVQFRACLKDEATTLEVMAIEPYAEQ